MSGRPRLDSEKWKAEAKKWKAEAEKWTAPAPGFSPYRPRETMSATQLDNHVAKRQIARAVLIQRSQANVFDPPSTTAEAHRQVEEFKVMIKDVEARMTDPERKIQNLRAEKNSLDAAIMRALRFAKSQGCFA